MGVRVRLTKNSSAYFPFWLAIPVVLVWYSILLVFVLLYGICWLAFSSCRAGYRLVARTVGARP